MLDTPGKISSITMRVYNSQTNILLEKNLVDSLTRVRELRHFDADTYIRAKSTLLNDYMKKHHLSACVIGISGGVDSATVLGILTEASKMEGSPIKKIIAALLPVFSKEGATNQKEALSRGKKIAKQFGITPTIIDLTKSHLVMKDTVDQSRGITGRGWATGQLVSYLRTPALYYLTSLLSEQKLSGVVIGTTNRDEGAYLGYFGKASDGMTDIQLISDIHKNEVYTVAKKLKVPSEVLSTPPAGDMFDGRTDEEVFGAPYDFVELYLYYLSLNENEKKTIANMEH